MRQCGVFCAKDAHLLLRCTYYCLHHMSLLPPSITRAIEEFQKLPGIGPKSAERLVFHLLRSTRADPARLGKALSELSAELCYCSICQMVTVSDPCTICADTARDHTSVLVVEEPLEVLAFEKTSYKGVYHVLHGVLSPIDGYGPEQLRLRELIERCKGDALREVIIATDPDVEGEATAAYIARQLQGMVPAVTRLAHGLPMGADIEFADHITLREALAGRRAV